MLEAFLVLRLLPLSYQSSNLAVLDLCSLGQNLFVLLTAGLTKGSVGWVWGSPGFTSAQVLATLSCRHAEGHHQGIY